jgi:hypothetical protein
MKLDTPDASILSEANYSEELEKVKENQSIKSPIFWDRTFLRTRGLYRFFYMTEVELEKIKIDQKIVVREKDQSLVNRLKPQIESEGLIEPLTVLDQGNGKFLLLAGQHRYHVCSELGVKTVPAKVYLNLDLAEQLTLGYMSNEVRKDPPAGRRYGALHEIFDETKRKLESKKKHPTSEAEVINNMYMAKNPQVAKFKVKEIIIGMLTDDLMHDKNSLIGLHGFISPRQVPKRKIISMLSSSTKGQDVQLPLLTSQNAFYGLSHLVRTAAVTQEEESEGRNFRVQEYENVKIFFDLLISRYALPWMQSSKPKIDPAMSICRRHVFETLCRLMAVKLRDKGFDIKTKDGTRAPLFTDKKVPWTNIFEELRLFFTPDFLVDDMISKERSLDVLWNRVEYYVLVKPGRMPAF